MNILNAKEKSGLDFSNFFNGVPENIIICINKEKTPLLYEQIMKKNCPKMDCLDELNEKKVHILSKSDECTTYHFSSDNNNTLSIRNICNKNSKIKSSKIKRN